MSQAADHETNPKMNIQCLKCKGLHYDYHDYCVICSYNFEGDLGMYDWCKVIE